MVQILYSLPLWKVAQDLYGPDSTLREPVLTQIIKIILISPFCAVAPFWGTNYLDSDWFVPRTGLQLAVKGLRLPRGSNRSVPIRTRETFFVFCFLVFSLRGRNNLFVVLFHTCMRVVSQGQMNCTCMRCDVRADIYTHPY